MSLHISCTLYAAGSEANNITSEQYENMILDHFRTDGSDYVIVSLFHYYTFD
jgi:hypothetical protein